MWLRLKWWYRLGRDVIVSGIVNRSILTSLAIMLFIVIGLVITAAQVSAPFIYTLF